MTGNSLKFGTSGLRGLVTDLVGAASVNYTLAFITYLKGKGELAEGGTLLVGRDLRDSSPAIAGAVVAAARHAGLNPIDCGELPTPALALESQRLGVPAVMVTGSHIPADRNGLKFYVAAGEIDKADEAGILDALPHVDGAAIEVKPLASGESSALARYERRYEGFLGQNALAGLRIGVFQHSSVARDLLVRVLHALGADAVELGRSDIFVPVDTEAISPDNTRRAGVWTADLVLDAIVSTDGDADRPLIIDQCGSFVRGDLVGLLTARFLGADVVVTPVTSNSAIESSGAFARVIRTRVGSPYVIAAMRDAEGVVVGFEANGGVLLGSEARGLSPLPTRDALLPILAVLGLMRAEGKSMSELVAELPPRFGSSDRLEQVPHDRAAILMEQLRRDAAAYFAELGEVLEVSDVDGLRFTLANGDVIHYRVSGNAPELRCYIEAATPERAEALLEWGLDAAERVIR
ncbi:phosphomannomutase [Paradevosia shaoguanensis]|uniref:phosphomannomutase n=1 Tax=Paradevosia shaoguanensis TaxID=1335043 RepID=UPI003C7944AE